MAKETLTDALRGNLGVMIISSGLWTLAGQLVWPYQSIYILRLGGSYLHIGLIASITSLAGIIPTIYGGYIADTIGRKKIISFMSILISLNALLFSFALDWIWLLVASVITSLAAGLRQPAFSSLIADSTSEKNRAQSYALWSIIPPLFGLASPYLMGTYMDRYGALTMLRTGYLALFIASIVASFLRFSYLEETLMEDEITSQGIGETMKNIAGGIFETIRALSRPLWVLGLMGLFFGFGAAVGGPFWVTYATDDMIQLTLSQWGFISAVNILTSTVIGIPLAKISDRSGRLKLLIPSIILTPFAIIGFTFCRDFVQVLLVSVLITVLGSMGMTSGQALFTDLTERRYRGRINALWNVAGTMQSFSLGVSPGSLIGASGSLIGGYLYEKVGVALPFYIQSGMVGLTAVTGLLFLKEPLNRVDT